MSDDDRPGPDLPGPAETRTVRPRWTWVGLAVLLIGLFVLGGAIIATSWPWAIAGIVVIAVGGAVAVYGGQFYDVQGAGSASEEVHEVVHGNEREFPAPGTTFTEDQVKEHVHEQWRRNREEREQQEG